MKSRSSSGCISTQRGRSGVCWLVRFVFIRCFRFRLFFNAVLDVIRRIGELTHTGAQGTGAVFQHVRSQTLHFRKSLCGCKKKKKNSGAD